MLRQKQSGVTFYFQCKYTPFMKYSKSFVFFVLFFYCKYVFLKNEVVKKPPPQYPTEKKRDKLLFITLFYKNIKIYIRFVIYSMSYTFG